MPHSNLIVLRPSDFSLKIDQSVKLSRHRLSMGVACSYSSAPDLDMHTIYIHFFFITEVMLFKFISFFNKSSELDDN